MKVFSKGFNYSQDGPGNRLVYHLQSCNFKCKWCSNPEGIGAVCNKTEEYTVIDICKEIQSCKPMFFDGGGVTFTGGEATMQFDELKAVLVWCKNNGINTAIETNGSHPSLPELTEYTDHLIMDIKHFDSQQHKYWTGNDGQITYKNLEKLCSLRKKFLIRIPLIKEVNLDANGFIRFFCKYDCRNVSFEFLAYHEYGRDKWTEQYEITDGFVTAPEYEQFKNAFTQNGFKVIST